MLTREWKDGRAVVLMAAGVTGDYVFVVVEPSTLVSSHDSQIVGETEFRMLVLFT